MVEEPPVVPPTQPRTPPTPPTPQTGSLTVNKQIFGCFVSPDAIVMNCNSLQNNSDQWISCDFLLLLLPKTNTHVLKERLVF